jgi:predicted small lipoprotein YifL
MVRILAAGLAAVVLISACGYKGPLVMPEPSADEKESTEKTKKQKTP